MAPLTSLLLLWLCGQPAPPAVLDPGSPPPAAIEAGNDAAKAPEVASDMPQPSEAGVTSPPTIVTPHYRADLGLDVGADTYLFHDGQTAFELEMSPRISFIVHPAIDVGFYAAAGYGGAIPAWSQMTMFGVGPFINFAVPLAPALSLNPWLGVMYHYAFIEGYTGAANATRVLQFPQQSVRVDLHADLSFAMGPHTALNVGPYFKSRLAPISEGPGTAAQLSYGLRISAVSSF